MDVSARLIKTNIYGAIVFSAYFYLQTCNASLRTLSFFAAIPAAKHVVDQLSIPVAVRDGCGYPVKELFANFLKRHYGIWSVLLIESIRRMACGGVLNGFLSITLMCAWLLGYVFSASTGVCRTNVKDYRRGMKGFTVASWLQIGISMLMGAGWSMRIVF